MFICTDESDDARMPTEIDRNYEDEHIKVEAWI